MQQWKETLTVTPPPLLPWSRAWGEHRWHSVAPFWPWLHYTPVQPQSLGTSSAKGGPKASPKTPFLPLPPQLMEPQVILAKQGMKTQWAWNPGKNNPGYKRSKHSKVSLILMSDRKPILSFKYILREAEPKKKMSFSSSSSSRARSDLMPRQQASFWYPPHPCQE